MVKSGRFRPSALEGSGYQGLNFGDVLQGTAHGILSGPFGWFDFIPAALGIESLNYLAGHNVAGGQLQNGTLNNSYNETNPDDPNSVVYGGSAPPPSVWT